MRSKHLRTVGHAEVSRQLSNGWVLASDQVHPDRGELACKVGDQSQPYSAWTLCPDLTPSTYRHRVSGENVATRCRIRWLANKLCARPAVLTRLERGIGFCVDFRRIRCEVKRRRDGILWIERRELGRLGIIADQRDHGRQGTRQQTTFHHFTA